MFFSKVNQRIKFQGSNSKTLQEVGGGGGVWWEWGWGLGGGGGRHKKVLNEYIYNICVIHQEHVLSTF